jgi:hypothetical protein
MDQHDNRSDTGDRRGPVPRGTARTATIETDDDSGDIPQLVAASDAAFRFRGA